MKKNDFAKKAPLGLKKNSPDSDIKLYIELKSSKPSLSINIYATYINEDIMENNFTRRTKVNNEYAFKSLLIKQKYGIISM